MIWIAAVRVTEIRTMWTMTKVILMLTVKKTEMRVEMATREWVWIGKMMRGTERKKTGVKDNLVRVWGLFIWQIFLLSFSFFFVFWLDWSNKLLLSSCFFCFVNKLFCKSNILVIVYKINEYVHYLWLGRSVRFADMTPDSTLKGKRKKKRLVKKTKAITPLQATMLRMAGMQWFCLKGQADHLHSNAILILLYFYSLGQSIPEEDEEEEEEEYTDESEGSDNEDRDPEGDNLPLMDKTRLPPPAGPVPPPGHPHLQGPPMSGPPPLGPPPAPPMRPPGPPSGPPPGPPPGL